MRSLVTGQLACPPLTTGPHSFPPGAPGGQQRTLVQTLHATFLTLDPLSATRQPERVLVFINDFPKPFCERGEYFRKYSRFIGLRRSGPGIAGPAVLGARDDCGCQM